MLQTQTPVNPALGALLQTAQMVTPEQTPTVAAQVAQAAAQKMQPQGITQGMPQAREDFQQAMPSVMRNMQEQQVRQMLQQASQPRPAGIEALPAPNLQRMADGGVVGYDGEEGSQVQDPEVQRILQKAPAARTPEENAILRAAGVELTQRSIPQDSWINKLNTALGSLFASAPKPSASAALGVRGKTGEPERDIGQVMLPPVAAPRPAQRPVARPPVSTPPASPAPPALPVMPTIDRSGIAAAGKEYTAQPAIERLKAIEEARAKAVAGMPDLSERAMAALEASEKARQEGIAKLAADDPRMRMKGFFRTLRGDPDAYDRFKAGIAQRDELDRKAKETHALALIELQKAQQAKQIGAFDRQIAAETRYTELENQAQDFGLRAQTIASQLAGTEYTGRVTGRGQDIQAQEAARDRASREKIAREGIAARVAGAGARGAITPRDLAKFRMQAEQQVDKALQEDMAYRRLRNDPTGQAAYRENMIKARVREALIAADYDLPAGYEKAAAPAAGAATRLRFDAQGNPIK